MSSHQEIVNKIKDHFQANELGTALNLIKKVIKKNPNDAEVIFWLGNIHYLHGKLGSAIKCFRKVLKLQPSHTEAAISLSVALNDVGQYQEAKKVFKIADQNVQSSTTKETGNTYPNDNYLNQKFSIKHEELGDMYSAHNRFEEALFEYEKSSKLSPDSKEIRMKIAKCYTKRGFTAKAKEVLSTVKSEDPTFIPAYVATGLIYYGQGKVVEAETEWKLGLKKDPDNKQIKRYLDIASNAQEVTL